MRQPAILVTSCATRAATGKNLGVAGYSYDIVAKLFLPLLQRWGEVIVVPAPHRDLEAAAEAARLPASPAQKRWIPSARGWIRRALPSGARRVYRGLVRPILSPRLAQTVSFAWKRARERMLR